MRATHLNDSSVMLVDSEKVVLPPVRFVLPKRGPPQAVGAMKRGQPRNAVPHRVQVAPNDLPANTARREGSRVAQDVGKLAQPSERPTENL